MVQAIHLAFSLLCLHNSYVQSQLFSCPPGFSDTTCCSSSCIFNETTENEIFDQTDLVCDTPVYDAPYTDITTIDQLMTLGPWNNASQWQYVLVGAKESSDTSTYRVAAVGRYRDVFRDSSLISGDVYRALQGLGPNAAHWYRVSHVAFGFAPVEEVELGLADLGTSQCHSRLSWQIDNGVSGWRAGCNVGDEVSSWRKILKLCYTTRYGVKTGTELLTYRPEFLQVYRASVWPALGQTINPIKIGTAVTLDQRSKRAGMGLIFKRAYSMFVEWVNTVRGGVSVQGVKRPIELILIGDYSDTTTVTQVTEHLSAAEGVQLFLGPYGSGLSRAAAAVVNTTGGTMVASVATSLSVFQDRPNVFGVYMSGADTFSNTMRELATHDVRKIAYVHESGYPAACDNMESMAGSFNMTVTWSYTFQSSQILGDIDPLVHLLTTTNESLKADALFGCVYQSVCEQLIQALIDRKIDVNAIVMTVCLGSTTWLSTFGDNGRYISGTTPWMPAMGFVSQVSNWTSYDFDAAYQLSYGKASSYHAALCWAAGIALMVAIETADSIDPNLVAAALRNMNINETIFGAIRFDDHGLNTNPWKTVQYLPGNTDATQVIPEKTQRFVYPIPSWQLRECFQFDAVTGACFKGLKNGECITCPETDSARWTDVGIGNNQGCKCVLRTCAQGEVLNLTYTAGIQCYACDAGKYAAVSGTCTSCPAGTFAAAASSAECTACAAGKVNNAIGQTDCVDCPPGAVSYTEGEQFCSNCRRGTTSSHSGGSACTLCAPGTVAVDEGAAECLDCPAGRESTWGGYECANCSAGKFQSQPKQSFCEDCPLGTTCHGEATIAPANSENWWRYHSPPEADRWLPCPDEGVCLTQEKCLTGQSDFLCGSCHPGYSRQFDSLTCSKCTSRVILAIMFSVGILAMSAGTLFVSSVAVRSALKSKAISDALLKLLFNYFTTISITTAVLQIIHLKKIEEDAQVTGQMPKKTMHWIFYLLSFSITEVILPVLQLDCFFDQGITAGEQVYVDTLSNSRFSDYFAPDVVAARDWLGKYHWNIQFKVMLFWFVGPVAFLTILLIVVFICLKFMLSTHHQYWREVNELMDAINMNGFEEARKGRDKEHCLKLLESVDSKLFGIYSYYKFAEMDGCSVIKHFLLDSEPIIVVSIFLIYPTQVQQFLEPLWCVDPANGLVGHVHSKRYGLECYQTDDPNFWMGLAGLVVWCIGVPVFAGFKIMYGGHGGSSMGKSSKKVAHSVHSLGFLRTWSFLMAGYEPGKEYWECIVLVRKSITVCLTAISMHDGARVLALLITSVAFSLLHITYRPFDNRYDELLDRVECRHLLVWVLFSLAILWIYLSSNLSANKLDLQLIGQEYKPEETTLYVSVCFMCLLHVFFILSLLYSLFEHFMLSRAEYLVNLAHQRHHLSEQHHHHHHGAVTRDGSVRSTESSGTFQVGHNASEISAVDPRSSKVTQETNVTTMTRITQFFGRMGSERQRQAYQDRIENNWFGTYAHWYYDFQMDTKAHILCDARNMWITLMGKRSHKCKPQHEVDKKLSQKKLPALAMPATEDQRRYLLKILMEAMHYIVVTCEIPTIPASLLEFIIRCGFTFQSMGELRMATRRESSHERTNNMARLVAAQKLEESSDTGKFSVSSGLGRASIEAGATMSNNEMVARSSQTMQSPRASTDLEKATPSPISPTATATIPPTPQSQKSRPSIGVSLASQSLGRASTEMTRGSTFHSMIQLSSNAREHRMECEYLVLSDEDLRSLVREMFAPDIFEEALSLEDFQLNLTMLCKTNRENMLRWLEIFDEDCIYHRALRVKGMLETRKTFRMEMTKVKSEKHLEKKKEEEAQQQAKHKSAILSPDSFGGMAKFARSSLNSMEGGEEESESSSSSSDEEKEKIGDEDSDAEFLQDEETQTDFSNKQNLAELGAPTADAEFIQHFSSMQAAFAGKLDDDATDMGDRSAIHQKWVLLVANVIHQADELAAKIPVTYAYSRCKKREEETATEIKALVGQIEEVKKALANVRENKRHGGANNFMKTEREDLECTRAAIKEAEADVEALKKELADLQDSNHEGTGDQAKRDAKRAVKLPTRANAPAGSLADIGNSLSNLRLCAMPTCGITSR